MRMGSFILLSRRLSAGVRTVTSEYDGNSAGPREIT
jgi:hypothetical protein